MNKCSPLDAKELLNNVCDKKSPISFHGTIKKFEANKVLFCDNDTDTTVVKEEIYCDGSLLNSLQMILTYSVFLFTTRLGLSWVKTFL